MTGAAPGRSEAVARADVDSASGMIPEPQVSRAKSDEAVNRGSVFTRRWVADLILDLAGYTPESRLIDSVAIEPACGPGAFVAAMAERLVQSCRIHGTDIAAASTAIIAVDIDPIAAEDSRRAVRAALAGQGVDHAIAASLAQAWIRVGDFLLIADQLPPADFVVGNPPYVRIEEVDPDSMIEYRERWDTMTGRADIYVGFIQAGLGLLKSEGRLGFICADRWMRNQYGTKLRRHIEAAYSMDACVVLHDVDAFESRVAAYPAITVLRNGDQKSTLVVDAEPTFDVKDAELLSAIWRHDHDGAVSEPQFQLSWLPTWFTTHGSWPAGSPLELAKLGDLEARLPTLEEVGVEVGVGVATGADDVYLVADAADIEPDRLFKIISAREVATGSIAWQGRRLVNPWNDDGLVDLREYPGLNAHLIANEGRIRNRYVARKNATSWWRTIDRVHPRVATMPKLLVPDLKDRIFPVLDAGEYYPLHSLYYLTSATWDLEALGGWLMSDIANLFVSSYSVRMSSGYMRVSAQYLRRVRIPYMNEVSGEVLVELADAFRSRDYRRASVAAEKAYGAL